VSHFVPCCLSKLKFFVILYVSILQQISEKKYLKAYFFATGEFWGLYTSLNLGSVWLKRYPIHLSNFPDDCHISLRHWKWKYLFLWAQSSSSLWAHCSLLAQFTGSLSYSENIGQVILISSPSGLYGDIPAAQGEQQWKGIALVSMGTGHWKQRPSAQSPAKSCWWSIAP